jgi:monoamine oxidase
MGEANIPFLGLTEDQIVKGVLKDLDQLFGNKTATKAYVRHLLVNWSKDPYIRGTYSSDSSEELAGPQVAWTDTRLVIAGEAYPVPTGHNGWVDGAALSGLHAAELVLHQISPDMMAKEGFSIRSGWLSGSDD